MFSFMGDAIDDKPSDSQYLQANVRAMYDKLAASNSFEQGVERLIKGVMDGLLP